MKQTFHLIIIIILSVLSVQKKEAQQPLFEPIVTDVSSANLMWSTDSQQLVFRSIFVSQSTVHIIENDWSVYNIVTKSLSQTDVFPLQPTLTRAESLAFDPAFYDNLESFIYVSPNERYIAYGELPTEQGWSVTIGDRYTREKIQTNIQVLNPFLADEFDVIWSADSNTLLVTTNDYSSQPFIQYVSNWNDNSTEIIYNFTRNLNIDNREFFIIKGCDLSADGHIALVIAQDMTATERTHSLILWDIYNTSSSIIVDGFGDIIGASFSPNDENQVLLVTERGFIQYDILTKTYSVININISSDWVTNAIFSPDGQWVALTDIHNMLYIETTSFITVEQS